MPDQAAAAGALARRGPFQPLEDIRGGDIAAQTSKPLVQFHNIVAGADVLEQ